MKYEIFDIQNALDACRTSLRTLNISDTAESNTNAAILIHSRSSSPIISNRVKKVMPSKRKLFQKQIQTKNRQRRSQRIFAPHANVNNKFVECGFNDSCDSMSLLSSTNSSNTTTSYGMIGSENDKKIFISNPNSSSSAGYCYESNYYPLIGIAYQQKPQAYSK